MADRLRFGLYGLLRGEVDPGTLARRGQLAEHAGFESLWVGDHIALPGRDGEQPRLEVVVAVSYLAAVTATVRLGFGVIVLPQRQPGLPARPRGPCPSCVRSRLGASARPGSATWRSRSRRPGASTPRPLGSTRTSASTGWCSSLSPRTARTWRT